MSGKPLVSVIVLNYNGLRWVELCLRPLLATRYRPVEWILVDNASTDGSVHRVRELFPEFRIIQSDRNLGYTGGNNLGIREARGTYVVLLNNDVVVEPDWLGPLVAEAEREEKIGALQPKLTSMIQPGYFEYAGASGGFIDRWGYPFLRGRIFDTMERDEGQYDDARDVFWASGAALFLRRRALEQTGLLDETMFMHFEEIDLCWRLHRAGYRVRVVPAAHVRHYVGASLPPESFRKVYWNHRNNLIMLIKNLPARQFWVTLAVRFMLDGAAACYGLWRGRPAHVLAVLLAHGWIYTHVRLLWQKRSESQRAGPLEDFSHLVYRRSIAADYFLKNKNSFRMLAF